MFFDWKSPLNLDMTGTTAFYYRGCVRVSSLKEAIIALHFVLLNIKLLHMNELVTLQKNK